MTNKPIHLAAFIFSGRATQFWRHPDVTAHDSLDIDYYIEYAQVAEKAKFDTLFLADGPAPLLTDTVHQHYWSISRFEPVTLFSALAARTSRIGLIYTASVSNNEPTHLARQLASLDHISHGRAGWNAVTTQGEGTANLGIRPEETLDSAAKYGRARAFVEVVRRLADSFEDDALPRDKASGIYADLSKIHAAQIDNAYYKVDRALSVERPPQGHPIIAQAGTSPEGLAFGGSHADLIYACALSIPDGQTLYKRYKAEAVKAGRRPEELLVLPGVAVVWGPTQEEAERRLREATSFWPIEALVENLHIDFGEEGPHLDAPFPQEYKMTPTGTRGRTEAIASYAHANNLTLRQTAERVSVSLGHRPLVGTTERIADDLQEWIAAGAADGFVVIQPRLLDGLKEFSEHVVPELQRRGVYPQDYEGTTLREHLGLERPENLYTAKRQKGEAPQAETIASVQLQPQQPQQVAAA